MNKKVLYGVILLSIFLMSAATAVKPVQGYKFGVPDQAKGVEGESEVKVYDKDAWADCFGEEGDRPDDIWDGDSDVVGAKSKSIVNDWEYDDESIPFFWDFVLESELTFNDPVTGQPVEAVEVYKDVIPFVHTTIGTTLGLQAIGGVKQALDAINSGALAAFGIPTNATWQAWGQVADWTLAYWMASTTTQAEAKVMFNDKYDGTMVTMDTWEYYEGAYPAKADEEDAEAPFMKDPENWYDSYQNLAALVGMVFVELDAFTLNGTMLFGGLMPSYMGGLGTNNVMSEILDSVISQTWAGPGSETALGASSNLTQICGGAAQGPGTIKDGINLLVPKKAGYLYMALEGGLPTYTPTGKYLKEAIDEFDIDEDDTETGHPAMNGAIPFKCDVSVDKEEMTVTMEFEFDDYIDPDDEDAEAELEDWEVTFYYGEYGSQSKVEYSDGDDIIYSKESLAIIPGFEITIVLGASAVAILGLIYVVMKKRKM
jgi:hypothetical protein